MKRSVRYGVWLAAAGTICLTPDALLMRLSEMDGFQMSAWRGLLMGSVLVTGWAFLSRGRRADLTHLKTGRGSLIVLCQFFNSMLFCLGIAFAPAAIVLLGVAAVPIFAALLSWLFLGEPTRAITWAAIAAVCFGISLAVLGKVDGSISLDATALIGAVFGLGVALALAVNFVVLRGSPDVPIMLAIGCGALLAGIFGVAMTGIENLATGRPWAMMLTGAIVLPVSFFMLSLAARHTHAANVSLLMLLETVLGPLWVWLGIGERPSVNMLIGGAIVVASLALYLLYSRQAQDGSDTA